MRAYEKLLFYQNICEIRKLTHTLMDRFRNSHLRLVGQMCDAARSAKQNIREGYSKDSAGSFAHAIKISRGSLEELEGDIDDCFEDSLINKQDYDKVKELIKVTFVQIDRYIDSLYRLDREGKWKVRFKK